MRYVVMVRVEVEGPEQHSRAVEKYVHGLAQEYLVGSENDETAPVLAVVGARAEAAVAVPIEDELCGSCRGKGWFDRSGKPTSHRGLPSRKCLDCGGSGRRAGNGHG